MPRGQRLFGNPALQRRHIISRQLAFPRGPRGARVAAIDQREATADEIALRRGDELFSVLRNA